MTPARQPQTAMQTCDNILEELHDILKEFGESEDYRFVEAIVDLHERVLLWKKRPDIASHTSPPELDNTIQCHTCKFEGTRGCMHHGYPENAIPRSCNCKLGTTAEEAMRNLNGTFIDVWTPEHDAAIRKAAREQFIEQIEDKLPRYPSDLGDMYLLSDIQGLRAQQEEEQG